MASSLTVHPSARCDVDRVLEVPGRREDAGVDDEAVAVRLGRLVVVAGVADFAAVGEEDEAAQVVERFAEVELAADAAAECLVGKPAQGVDGSQQLAVFQQRFGEHDGLGAVAAACRRLYATATTKRTVRLHAVAASTLILPESLAAPVWPRVTGKRTRPRGDA